MGQVWTGSDRFLSALTGGSEGRGGESVVSVVSSEEFTWEMFLSSTSSNGMCHAVCTGMPNYVFF